MFILIFNVKKQLKLIWLYCAHEKSFHLLVSIYVVLVRLIFRLLIVVFSLFFHFSAWERIWSSVWSATKKCRACRWISSRWTTLPYVFIFVFNGDFRARTMDYQQQCRVFLNALCPIKDNVYIKYGRGVVCSMISCFFHWLLRY